MKVVHVERTEIQETEKTRCRWHSDNGCANVWHPCGQPCRPEACADYRVDKAYSQTVSIQERYDRDYHTGGMSYAQLAAFQVHAFAMPSVIEALKEPQQKQAETESELGGWVRFYRLQADLSVEQLAQRCAVMPKEIEEIERSGACSRDMMRKIMQALQTDQGRRTGGRE